jgi:hypothetical protein
MQFTRYGRKWETLRGYDVTVEARVVELRDITNDPTGEVVACGIKPMATGILTFEQYREDLPKELLNWFREDTAGLLG